MRTSSRTIFNLWPTIELTRFIIEKIYSFYDFLIQCCSHKLSVLEFVSDERFSQDML
jgi:hypothetical protein